MKDLFLDTNIILDLLARRMPFYPAAARLFSLADKKKVQLSISALSLANVQYILSKQIDTREVRTILRKFKVLVRVLPLDGKILDLALNLDFNDFEDAIQYYTALEHGIESIITRNQRDFRAAKISAFSADEIVKLLG